MTVPVFPDLVAAPRVVMVTASYGPDWERCRLLCETVDRHVSGLHEHLILVEPRDRALFRQLEGPRRRVIDERALLPSWLRAFPDPWSPGRRLWLSPFTPPLRGWHAQQLRRIAVAGHTSADLLVFCDSDVLFVKPFDLSRLAVNGRARLYRLDHALPGPERGRHREWSRQAGRALGLGETTASPHDYIATLIAWRRDAALGLQARIEAVTGRHWAAGIARSRDFSECLLYGRFVDEVLGGAGHQADPEGFCRIHWTGAAMGDDDVRRFVAGMREHQVAVGMQSFIGTDPARIRRVLGEGLGITPASRAAFSV